MQFPESWLREFCDPPICDRRARRAADHGRAGGRGRCGRSRRRSTASSSPRCSRSTSIRTPTGCASARSNAGGGETLRDRLRRAERARRHQGAAGAASAPSCRRRARRRASRFAIEVGKLRGVESRGMLCSARELKLSDDHGGLLILDDDAPVGADLREHLQLDDTIFTLKLTPNLGHVPQRLRRRARGRGADRRAAACRRASPPAPVGDATVLPVQVEAPDLCGRFSGRIVRGVDTHGEDAGVDGRPPGALRPAHGHAAGRHLELRDVRVRPAVAHLRPRQDRRRPRRCAGAGRARR